MQTKVLIAYASTHGSTREVAETIAATLRQEGLEVDVRLASETRSLDGYRAVVLGAPLYMFKLHKDALRFLTRHQGLIEAGLPVAVFAGGPIERKHGDEWTETRKQVDEALAKYPWFEPVSIEIVGGRHDPNRLRLPWSLLPALRQMPAVDLRDWDAIHGWARGLAEQFKPEAVG